MQSTVPHPQPEPHAGRQMLAQQVIPMRNILVLMAQQSQEALRC